MTKTILITGTSSGYGKATAEHFLSRDWNVIATMRQPDPSLFAASDRLRLLPLDVTSPDSIASLFEAAGPIDVLVNNAGLGGVGAFEAMPMSLIRQLFETNTIGVMSMCQAVIPQMRERRSGTIVNVTSSVALGEFPLAAAYTATKQAIEGFSASLAHELGYFGVRMKLVEPGYAPTTRFGANASCLCQNSFPANMRTLHNRSLRHSQNRRLLPRKAMLQKQSGRPFTIPRPSFAFLLERTLSHSLRRGEEVREAHGRLD